MFKIVSGGQTGVDRAALDAAIEAGIPHGGFCPRNRKAEDGRIPDRYQLKETFSSNYKTRTILNIAESDGTLILTNDAPLTGGTKMTADEAKRMGKPCLVVRIKNYGHQEIGAMAHHVAEWIFEHGIRTLNVAGPRESKVPYISRDTKRLILEVLQLVAPKIDPCQLETAFWDWAGSHNG